jgi:uncharacterized ion transporter superfamily protein YfcC
LLREHQRLKKVSFRFGSFHKLIIIVIIKKLCLKYVRQYRQKIASQPTVAVVVARMDATALGARTARAAEAVAVEHKSSSEAASAVIGRVAAASVVAE